MHAPARDAAPRADVRVHAARLWTMARGPYLAQCDLRQRAQVWELVVFIDDQLLLSRHCVTPLEAGAVSSGWRTRLSASGWSQPGEWMGVDAR